MKRCGNQCPGCPFVKERKFVSLNRGIWKINTEANCETKNIVYLIECGGENCKERYIEESSRSIKERIKEHSSYIKKYISNPTGLHFNLPGHSLGNMKMTILEKVAKNDDMYRQERERHLIRKFNTFYHGINRQP